MTNIKAAPIQKWYRRIGTVSVGAVLFLILVGGIVRSTGSGMGCPDWPFCFGLVVPPTEVSEIPQAFFDSHPEYSESEFNGFQTWVEYLNRLVGATIGLLALATFALSLGYWRRDKRIPFLSFLALFLTGFEAWLGKLVVDQNLAGGMVTIHMLGAIIILAVLITAVYLAATHRPEGVPSFQYPSHVRWLGIGVALLTVVQILLGTQVREQVDEIAIRMSGMDRDTWVDQLGGWYAIHRVLWIVLTLATVWWVRNILALNLNNASVRLFAIGILICLGLEVLVGVLVAQFGLPPVLQPVHLLLANLMFALEFALLVNFLGVELILKPSAKADTIDKRTFANAKR